MFDFDEDIFREPSEVEKIILAAKEDIVNLFSADVQKTIDDAAGAKKRLEQLQNEIRSAEFRLSSLQEQVKSAEERVDRAELFDIPARYINKFVRNATHGLAPGDKVWVIETDYAREECKTCKGRKKVTARINGNDIEIQCPECSGYGTKAANRSKVVQRTIESIHLKLCFDTNRVNYWNTECVGLHGLCNNITAERVYKSEEAALAAIAKEA